MASYTLSLLIESTNKATGPLKNLNESLKDLRKVAEVTTGVLGEMYGIGQKLFEFGKLGATVNQTSDSFARLGMDLGALRTAAGGTVDDMTLMSSTLTLAAGASEQLQAAFATSTDDLLAIAKAASALNPTLGDTTYMYESLALGIKRGSPMILDNLGLTISLSQANADYAASIGKSVDALTDEEKKIALLNATVAAGNRLIEQNGNSTLSAADGFDRLTASATNLKNSFAQATKGVGDLFGGLARGIDGISNWQRALNMAREQGLNPFAAQLEVVREALGANNTVFDEMREQLAAQETAELRAIATGEAYARLHNEQIATAIAAASDEAGNSLDVWQQYQQAQQVSSAAINSHYELANAVREADTAAATSKSSFLDAAAAISDMSVAQFAAAQIDALRSTLDGTPEAAQRFVEAQQAILTQFGLLTPAEQAAQTQLGILTAQYTSGQLSAEAYAVALSNVKGMVDGLQSKTVDVTYNLRTVGVPPPEMGGPVTGGPGRGERVEMQNGFSGIFTTPTVAVFGEGGPERVTAQPMNNVTNYNLAVNSVASAGNVVQDFNMMRAFAGR